MGRYLLWGVAIATLAVYGAMVLWSLPRVAEAAGGLPPFDMRPPGYSDPEARAFLSALTPDGRAFYGSVQHALDIAFPALFALTLILSFDRLIRPRGLRLALGAVALAQMAADYTENALVARMLALPAAEVPPDLIARASLATLTKSALVTVAMTALLVAIVAALLRRRV